MINTDKNYIYSDLTDKIIGIAYRVFNELGAGFLEKIYENAMKIELENDGLVVIQQHPIKVFYKSNLVGEYCSDLLVEGKVIVELKAVTELNNVHEVQLVNYLKATGFKVGLLINFGDKVKVIRRVH